MYRVLLAEDEKTVREGILKKIVWEDHGFELAGACENGRQALEVLENGPVDVVITDINMPVMDGLALAGQVHERWPATRVVILTGYDDFGYAQTAIRYRVSEYILKPITARQLRELLDKLRAELDKSLAGSEQLRAIQHRQLLKQLLAGTADPDELESLLRQAPFAFGDGPACAALAGPGDGETIRALLHHILRELAIPAELLVDDSGERVVLLCGGENPAQAADTLLRRAAQELSLSAVIGSTAPHSGALCDSYRLAQDTWGHLYRLPPGSVLTAADLLLTPSAEPVLGDARRAVLRGVKLLDPDQTSAALGTFLSGLAQSTWQRGAVLGQMQKLVHLLSEYADEQGLAAPDSVLAELDRTGFLDQARGVLARYVDGLIRAAELRGDTSSRQGMLAVEYIKEHYREPDLSLQRLTGYLSVSTSSFSVLFKAYTGTTFVEFLTRLRINKAQELVASTDWKNYEIASEIGYDDPGYFRTIFKKYTGLSPSEYRKKHRA